MKPKFTDKVPTDKDTFKTNKNLHNIARKKLRKEKMREKDITINAMKKRIEVLEGLLSEAYDKYNKLLNNPHPRNYVPNSMECSNLTPFQALTTTMEVVKPKYPPQIFEPVTPLPPSPLQPQATPDSLPDISKINIGDPVLTMANMSPLNSSQYGAPGNIVVNILSPPIPIFTMSPSDDFLQELSALPDPTPLTYTTTPSSTNDL